MLMPDHFLERWEQYFPGQGLPIVFDYTDKLNADLPEPSLSEDQCIICDFQAVLQGEVRVYDSRSIRCHGARRYLGFDQETGKNFRYFLSCGIPEKLEGERYKKSPELVDRWLQETPPLKAPAEYIVFKRIDQIKPEEQPLAVCFFAKPDVLSGLFTLAGYDLSRLDGVITPFGSGCASMIYYPMREILSGENRAVIGMFDVSARPCVKPDHLTFTIPWARFIKMVENMDESFLTTGSWGDVRGRLAQD